MRRVRNARCAHPPELGPRDLTEGNCCIVRRDNGEKVTAKIEGIVDEIKALLDAIHDNMYTVAEKEP